MAVRSLAVDPEGLQPKASYALSVLLGLLGVEPRPANGDAELTYGKPAGVCSIARGPQEHWDDPRPGILRTSSPPIVYRQAGPTALQSSEWTVGFDLLYATYACLTAPWESADPVDEVGCPIAASGWLARNDLLDEPIVHRYADVLGHALGIEHRRECAIVLTHDVDDNFAHLFSRRASLELLRRDLRSRPIAAPRRAAGLLRRLAKPAGQDPNDRFEDWLTWHEAWHSRPAFFVSSWNLFQPQSDRHDVAYDVRHPTVRSALRRLAGAGAEIGVHYSIGASRSSEQLRREREVLEEVVGTPVKSARHHWWALGTTPERTFALQAKAGIEVDCSLGFNDRPGFRRGIASPFRPYDPATERAGDVWVLPTIAMDAAIFRAGRPRSEALAELQSLERTVRQIGGCLVLDWHVHSANPAALPGAAEGLRRFLDDAAASGTRLATPLEIVAWRGSSRSLHR